MLNKINFKETVVSKVTDLKQASKTKLLCTMHLWKTTSF